MKNMKTIIIDIKTKIWYYIYIEENIIWKRGNNENRKN